MSIPPESSKTSAFSSVKTTNLSAETFSWLSSVIDALDRKDIEAYCTFLAPEVNITFNNGQSTQPNTSGIEAVKTALTGFWQTFKTIQHEEIGLFESGTTVIHEALNHYEALDGRKVSLRAVAVMDRNEQGLIRALRIYSDQSPLFNA